MADMRSQLLRLGNELFDERRYVTELQARLADTDALIVRMHQDLNVAQEFRAGVEASSSWQLLQTARRRLYGALGGRESRLGHLFERSIRVIARGALRKRR
jgi:hypothetical protein